MSRDKAQVADQQRMKTLNQWHEVVVTGRRDGFINLSVDNSIQPVTEWHLHWLKTGGDGTIRPPRTHCWTDLTHPPDWPPFFAAWWKREHENKSWSLQLKSVVWMVKLGNSGTLTSWERGELLNVPEQTSANQLFNKSFLWSVGYTSRSARLTGDLGTLLVYCEGQDWGLFSCWHELIKNVLIGRRLDRTCDSVRAVSTLTMSVHVRPGYLSRHQPRRILIFHTTPLGGPGSFTQPHFCHILYSFLF